MPNVIEAIDWGCRITFNYELEENIKYIGIRAHYLEICEDDEVINTFNCWVVFTSEALFRTKVYIKFSEPIVNEKDYHVMCDISKEEWDLINQKSIPFKIKINPDKVIKIKGN